MVNNERLQNINIICNTISDDKRTIFLLQTFHKHSQQIDLFYTKSTQWSAVHHSPPINVAY